MTPQRFSEGLILNSIDARQLAETQALRGLGMAFDANAAHAYAGSLAAGHRWARDMTLAQQRVASDEHPVDSEQILASKTAWEHVYLELSDAAGALIGPGTLGGDLLSVQAGRNPELGYPDGATYAF